MKVSFAALSLALAALATGPTVTSAADAPVASPAPAADFARLPRYSDLKFAPDGARFAALQVVDGRANLTVGDLDKRTLTRVTSFTTYDVRSYRWISNTRLVLSLYDSTKGLAEQRGGGLFAVDHDGSNARELSPTWESCEAQTKRCRQTRFVRAIPDSDGDIVAAANERDIRTEDLYRLNTRTGKKTLLTERTPPQVAEWVLDASNRPRAAVSEDGKTRTETFWYRDDADAPWRQISTSRADQRRIRPAAFDSDGSLLVFSNLDSDTFELHEFDAKSGKPGKLVLKHPVADLDSAALITVAAQGYKIAGIRIDGDKPETVWFDEKYAKLQALLDVSLPKGNVNRFDLLKDGRVAVLSYSDRDPGQYYLYDPARKQLEEVLQPRDWIKPERMSPMTVFRYKARDGLEIPAYLTLPVGREPKNLPLVAVIHGGPFGVRDEWGFEPDIQFLASRGYAVLQPNYRGSGGYGLRHYSAGAKQWGQAMQDDVTDGVKALIAQGTVDAARVCIQGGSYGGYATLMALEKEPDLFKCGIDEAGVSDLFWLGELGYSDFNQIDAAASEAFQEAMVGDPKADRAMMQANSPRLHADRIKSPLMIVHAVRDQRVPFKHAEGMRDAMQAAGKPVEWVVYPDEAHGFIKLENRVDRYNRIEAFLRKNIGGP